MSDDQYGMGKCPDIEDDLDDVEIEGTCNLDGEECESCQ